MSNVMKNVDKVMENAGICATVLKQQLPEYSVFITH